MSLLTINTLTGGRIRAKGTLLGVEKLPSWSIDNETGETIEDPMYKVTYLLLGTTNYCVAPITKAEYTRLNALLNLR